MIAADMGRDRDVSGNTSPVVADEVPVDPVDLGDPADTGDLVDIGGPDGSDEPVVTGVSDDTDTGDTDVAAAPGSDLSFYDASRASRYEAFSAANPDLSIDEVVWRVNVDLDKTPYKDISEAKNPASMNVLVNKYFYLPKDYEPANLVSIGNSMMRADAAEAMKKMINDAASQGHNLWVQSGYRSFSTQSGLFSQYSARDGVAAAETYSARPGHSEHQTGLAADFNTISDAFGNTPEGKWAADNSWMYGFIVRYTADNKDITLFKSEPWHMRYVGKEVAEKMHDDGILSFEEYWVKYINNW